MKVTGLPLAYCHSVSVRYKFWGQSEITKLTPVKESNPKYVESDSNISLEVELEFDHTQVRKRKTLASVLFDNVASLQ